MLVDWRVPVYQSLSLLDICLFVPGDEKANGYIGTPVGTQLHLG